MNEVSGGKQEMASSSAWDTMVNTQPPTTVPSMHHMNPPLSQEASPPATTQVIVPTPVKLQPPLLSPPPIAGEHVLGHVQQPAMVNQVC